MPVPFFPFDGGATWSEVGQSTNECFVTLTAPTLTPMTNAYGQPGTSTNPDSNYKLFQTVLYYACSKAGATNSNTTVANTWSMFTSSDGTGPANICAYNSSNRQYDRRLYYYGWINNEPTTSQSVESLLSTQFNKGKGVRSDY